MSATIAVDDDLWSAIGDPTRRRMLDLLLHDGDATATSLSDQLPVTRQAVSKHLAVLDRAGLVHGTASGRERRFRVDDEQLARAVAQLSAVGSAWDGRLRRIARLAETLHAETLHAETLHAETSRPETARDPQDRRTSGP